LITTPGRRCLTAPRPILPDPGRTRARRLLTGLFGMGRQLREQKSRLASIAGMGLVVRTLVSTRPGNRGRVSPDRAGNGRGVSGGATGGEERGASGDVSSHPGRTSQLNGSKRRRSRGD